MSAPRLVIIGGGLAGLSAGCYARASGLDVTIVEHNLELGGVCTAWHHGPYLIDGSIHWLTGGPFRHLYEELGILPAVPLRVLDEFATCRHARDGWEVSLRRDLGETESALRALAPEDAAEISRLIEGARRVADMTPPVDRPPELASLREKLRELWHLAGQVGTFAHYSKPSGEWAADHLRSVRLQSLFRDLTGPDLPIFFFLFILGYLERGWLSRPIGGTGRFRDTLVERYHALGGETVLNTTVEEVLVENGRATGVRLTDGTLIDADVVVSTASAPETVFRLLAGRYGSAEWRKRMREWRMVDAIVLASFGIARPLDDEPSTLIIHGIEPLGIGDVANDHLYLRIYNEDPVFAPPGHTVVQTMLRTSYDWWATRGARYQHEKGEAAHRILAAIDRHLPGVEAAWQATDIATPLTFWRNARSWRGAYEGWQPGVNSFRPVSRQLRGLDRFWMAGQWVEHGGGVPVAIMSGRHVVELICNDMDVEFSVPLETAALSAVGH